MIDEEDKVTKTQMDKWVNDFDSWDICDGICIHLFRKASFAYDKIDKWIKSNKEFIRRAAFILIATLSGN